MVKVEELKNEIKDVEKQYKNAKTDRAKYMLWRRLINLRKELAEYYKWQEKDNKWR